MSLNSMQFYFNSELLACRKPFWALWARIGITTNMKIGGTRTRLTMHSWHAANVVLSVDILDSCGKLQRCTV